MKHYEPTPEAIEAKAEELLQNEHEHALLFDMAFSHQRETLLDLARECRWNQFGLLVEQEMKLDAEDRAEKLLRQEQDEARIDEWGRNK